MRPGRGERVRPGVRPRGPRYTRPYIRRHGKRHAWGPGVTFWFYDGWYYGNCEWLRRRALATGSDYWWYRYRRCRSW